MKNYGILRDVKFKQYYEQKHLNFSVYWRLVSKDAFSSGKYTIREDCEVYKKNA